MSEWSDSQAIIAELKVYSVACDAALLDFRKVAGVYPDLLHPSVCAFCQSVGSRIHREGHPGLLTQSVRRPARENIAILNADVLSNPRHGCALIYRLDGQQIVVEKQPGMALVKLDVAGFSQEE
jgi:hypothetical protein